MSFKASYKFVAVDKFTAVSRKISASAENVKTKLKQVGVVAAMAGKKVGKAFAKPLQSTAGKMAALAGGFFGAKKFLEVGGRFQDAIAELSAITGASGPKLQKYRDQILEIAKATAIAQDQVALAFTQVASSKSELLTTEGALAKVTEQSLLLANAAGIEITDAVRASIGALNQFNKGADQAGRFINVIAAGSKVGSSMVFETAEALKNVGTVAAATNLNFEQTNALLQVLAKSEIKGSEAGNALKNVLLSMDEAINKVKVDLSVTKNGLIPMLEKLEKAGLDNVDMMKIFGRENITAAQVLVGNIPLIKQWTTELTGSTVAQEQASVRLSTFNARMRKLGVSINDKVIRTFERLEPFITKAAEDFTAWLDTIDEAKIKRFIEDVKEIANSFKEVATTVNRIGAFFGEGETGKLPEITQKINKTEFREISWLDVVKSITGGFGSNQQMAAQAPNEIQLIDRNKPQANSMDVNIKVESPVNTKTSVKRNGFNGDLKVADNMALAGY